MGGRAYFLEETDQDDHLEAEELVQRVVGLEVWLHPKTPVVLEDGGNTDWERHVGNYENLEMT